MEDLPDVSWWAIVPGTWTMGQGQRGVVYEMVPEPEPEPKEE